MDFLYNVQHDCPLAKCTASGKQLLMQEHIKSGLFQAYIEHQPVDCFVINTHAFHNAHLLRATLPHSLVAPILLYENQEAKHVEITRDLQNMQEVKWTAAKVRASQKKQEAIDKTGPGPSKWTRMEMEETPKWTWMDMWLYVVNLSGADTVIHRHFDSHAIDEDEDGYGSVCFQPF